MNARGVYHLSTHAVTFSPDKTPLKGNEAYDHALTSNDIFYGKDRVSILIDRRYNLFLNA